MAYLFLALALLAAGGLLSLVLHRFSRACLLSGTATTLAGCAAGLGAAGAGLVAPEGGEYWHRAWSVPGGSFSFHLDALAGFFLLVIFLAASIIAIYAAGYWGHDRALIGRNLCLFQWLIAALAVVATAANAILFLIAWEVMTLTSFFLVTTDDAKPEVRRAGLIYLIASHLGTASLLILFGVWGNDAGSLDFAHWSAPASPHLPAILFLLALAGFGTKAGLVPLHVWLPHAHPVAPSPVSALLSGVMIKLGVYGLLRVLSLLGTPPAWWGALLLALGCTSAVVGVLYALAQQDLKRVLAYSSVENMGIITLGLGVGVLGLAYGSGLVAFAGFAGALLHVLNHSLFKSLLFCCAGAVLHSTGTRRLDDQGGLLRRMPFTGTAFLAGCLAICGLPPFNGFVSEFLVYYGLLQGSCTLPRWGTAVTMAAVGALAFVGGLAAAAFLRAFGTVFLGEPRTETAATAHEAGWLLRLPMVVFAALCLVLGLFPLVGLRLALPPCGLLCAGAWSPAQVLAGGAPGEVRSLVALFGQVGAVFAVLFALATGLMLLRGWLLHDRTVGVATTWGCGYAYPTARMQYTASSFAQPIVVLFRRLLGLWEYKPHLKGPFPAGGVYETRSRDLAEHGLFRPVFAAVAWLAGPVHWLQRGYIQVYLLYIFATLFVLLLWQLGWNTTP
jgi:hydrogenase-4 component B